MFRRDCYMINKHNLDCILRGRPVATAKIRGSSEYPDIVGMAEFYQTEMGTLVVTEVSGLPQNDDACMSPVFGYHIHSGQFCTGNSEDAFADTKGHYSIDNCMHPYHTGDMPPLFGNQGYAFSIFLSDRFNVYDILGRTVVIHLHSDDFHTQPSGNSGMKIACGMINYNGLN